MNQIQDLLTKEELEKYNSTEYPFNVEILNQALIEKLKEDSEYEVWVPLVYYKNVTPARPVKTPVIKPYKYFVSNKGNILSKRRINPVVMKNKLGPVGYPQVQLVLNKRTEYLSIHRAVACSFVPMSKDLGATHPKDLILNHID